MDNPLSIITEFAGNIADLLTPDIPDGELPLLPLRGMMLFPAMVGAVNVTRESSFQLLTEAEHDDTLIAVLTQRSEDVEHPSEPSDFYPVGVAARVLKILELPGNHRAAILQSLCPIRGEALRKENGRLMLAMHALQDIVPEHGDQEMEALAENIREAAGKLARTGDNLRMESLMAIQQSQDATLLVNFLATHLALPMDEKDEMLRERDVKRRAFALMRCMDREVQFANIKRGIHKQTMQKIDKQQQEYFLRQEMETIQNKLGEQNPEIAELLARLEECPMPEKSKETLRREVKKLERMAEHMPDYSISLTYVQTVLDLPWGKRTDDRLDVAAARDILERDHYAMKRVKERILEHLASLQFSKTKAAPILCLVGPPGVGKTSLGRSIAEALGRKYVRISLGGVHDEAEIRGHRRTYIAAMPGRIVKAIQKAEVVNPLFVLDEIDKVAAHTQTGGDPQSALLEVLDPEQNSTFHDNYLDIPFDLSQVFFIATANTLQGISQPLLDRMEVVHLDGYLTEEKIEIARRHLIPRLQGQYEFPDKKRLRFTPKCIEYIIEHYTRESGVRALEKTLARLFRKTALALTETARPEANDGNATPEKEKSERSMSVSIAQVKEFLGKEPYNRDRWDAGGRGAVGVVTGLAWTSVGGEILFIETSVSRAKTPALTLTGNLGDVMKESAMLAFEWVKAHAERLQIPQERIEEHAIHLHVPEGATPKDGPSAGITMATSIASALTGRKVREHLAMTGEITLRGRVLPVGGIKEKILAAKRAGVTDIMLSVDNQKDIDELEEDYRRGLTFHFVRKVEDVLEFALLPNA